MSDEMKAATPRQRARAAALVEMKEVALRQLAAEGAQSLSLRAVARDVGLVPSGIYRYFTNRDELLTELIVDGYVDLAAALEDAAALTADPRARWRAVCAALRRFAREQPHRFHLLYGTPVTNYRAPDQTVEPAARVVQALVAPLREAAVPASGTPDPAYAAQLERMGEALGGGFPPGAVAAATGTVAQLLGLLLLELGGHLVGTFDPADALYADAVERLADQLVLR